jgi:hypothetical protein
MWRVLFNISKHNPLARMYEPKVDNLLHESWHTEEYLGAKQLPNFP